MDIILIVKSVIKNIIKAKGARPDINDVAKQKIGELIKNTIGKQKNVRLLESGIDKARKGRLVNCVIGKAERAKLLGNTMTKVKKARQQKNVIFKVKKVKTTDVGMQSVIVFNFLSGPTLIRLLRKQLKTANCPAPILCNAIAAPNRQKSTIIIRVTRKSAGLM